MTRRRWAPGRGWTRTLDCGDLAVWMRPNRDGISIAVYTGSGFGRLEREAEVWIVDCPAGTLLPHEVMDKPHRVRWVLDTPSDDVEYGALSVERRRVPRSHRGHRRLNPRRRVWVWPLPRRIRAVCG